MEPPKPKKESTYEPISPVKVSSNEINRLLEKIRFEKEPYRK
jgi:hypothetical protein